MTEPGRKLSLHFEQEYDGFPINKTQHCGPPQTEYQEFFHESRMNSKKLSKLPFNHSY